jgi:hypothetical protein
MVACLVTLGRHRYAVGLYWENSPGTGRVAQIAREAASQPGQRADFYAVRPGNNKGRIPQFGLTGSEAGQKSGTPVLAACLAGQVPGSWAGAFRVNEGIVLFVVREDLIVPDGDLYFQDENEARDRLVQEIGFGGLQNTYAPESWSIPGADTIPLALLLNDNQDIKLQQVHVPKKLKIIAASVALAFVLIVGAVWYWQEKVAEENARRAQSEEALRRAREAANSLLPSGLQQQAAPPPKYDRRWESAPPAMDVINACQQGLAKVPAALAGWKLASLKCSGSSMSLSWSREKGTTEPPPGSTVNDSASQASQNIPLAGLQPRGAQNLLDPDEITKRYLLQNWPGSIGHMADDPLPPPPEGYKGQWNPPPPPWVKRSFTLNVSQLPADTPNIIGDIPGSIVTNMNYSPNGMAGAWVIEGVIYENRK